MSAAESRFRAQQVALACCLSGIGLCLAVLRLLTDPESRLSRWVDREVLPYGVTRS